jgi:putative oxidoreductase
MIDVGLLVLRAALGLVVAAHGAQKLFGWWGGGGVAGTQRMFGSLGFRPPRLAAIPGGLAKLGGGLLVVLGLLTPLGCLALIVMMLGAIVSVHMRKGWWNTGGGSEFPALVAAAAFGLTMTGPGRYSLDGALDLSIVGWSWTGGVLAVSVVATIVIVALVRTARTATTAEPPLTATPRASAARP